MNGQDSHNHMVIKVPVVEENNNNEKNEEDNVVLSVSDITTKVWDNYIKSFLGNFSKNFPCIVNDLFRMWEMDSTKMK